MTVSYNLKGLPELIVFLLVDANDVIVFNAVLIFLIFLSSYSLITSFIRALFESGAFLRYNLSFPDVRFNYDVRKFHSIYLY